MSKNNGEYLIIRNDNKYEVIIGLEVHAQVLSESKLFSTSSTKFGSEPNTQVSLVDAAFPGMLPVINEHCIKQAVKTGIGLKAKINKRSIFDRKNYFYADLPQGYQISQYKDPIVGEGSVTLDMPTTMCNLNVMVYVTHVTISRTVLNGLVSPACGESMPSDGYSIVPCQMLCPSSWDPSKPASRPALGITAVHPPPRVGR